MTDTLQGLLREPHHLGFPILGETGTHDTNMVLVSREWYDRLCDLAASEPSHPASEELRAALAGRRGYQDSIGRFRFENIGPVVQWEDIEDALAARPADARPSPEGAAE